MVEIASTQLECNVIQWYDLYETYHGVPSWGQFKRELLIHFGSSEYKNVNGQLVKICQVEPKIDNVESDHKSCDKFKDKIANGQILISILLSLEDKADLKRASLLGR
ncbi:hypothetical protein BHE74_00033907 [Ensete ventricosum]|nr:hypothetical protein BHE74_00033907 [Ensete ventricosum]RZR97768.1 hypothetical protein BHM03_00027013 [Ensete ventricosum]